jgi:tetratricopeptide (TPR) repeat protein
MPTTWRWQQWRGDVAVAQHDWQSARTYYETALAALEDDNRFAWVVAVKARLHFALAEACIQMGDYTHAGIQYAAAEHLVPNDPMIAFNRGLLAFAQGNSDEAVRLCKEAYSNANTTIQEHMAHTLRGDLRYNDFSTKVLG